MPKASQNVKQIIHYDMPYQKPPIWPELNSYIKSIDIEPINSPTFKPTLTYTVLPDYSVVMGFQYRGSLYLIEKKQSKKLHTCGISGLQTVYKIFKPESYQTKTVLVRLYPWAINAFFNEDAHYFTSQAVGLIDVIKASSVSHLQDQLATTIDPFKLSHIIQQFLLNMLNANKKAQSLPRQIITIAQQLSNFDNIVSIDKLAKTYHLSKRNTERKFKNIIGLSPQAFLRLGQFRKAIHLLVNDNNVDQIIEKLHYYDQPHFINSFKQFSGLTPSQFKRSLSQ